MRREADKLLRQQRERVARQKLLADRTCPRCHGPMDRLDRKRCAACRKRSRGDARQRRLGGMERVRYQQRLDDGLCPRCQGPLDRADRKRCVACRQQARDAECQRRLRQGCFPTGLYREHRLDCVSLCISKDTRPGTFTVTAIYLEPEDQRRHGPGRLEMSGLQLEQLRGVLGMCRLLEPADRSRLLPALVTEAIGMVPLEQSEQAEPVGRRLRLVV